MSTLDHQPADSEPALTDAEREGWPSAEPSPGFAERVMAARARDAARDDAPSAKPAPRGRGWRWNVGWVAVAAVLLSASGWWLSRARPAEGSLVADQRRSVTLGERAVAVAESGTVMRWRVEADGAATVYQDAGRVFYRVDEGERFEVLTPRGTVGVEGTCFTVEMKTMQDDSKPSRRSTLKPGLVGAALASAVVVTVYEGRVAVADDRTEVSVDAGQRARSQGGHGWTVDDDSGPRARPGANSDAEPSVVAMAGDPVAQLRKQALTLERMRAANEAQLDEIDELRKQLGKTDPAEAAAKQARTCAQQARAEGCSIADPDQETLLELARCGGVQVDIPGFITLDPSEDIATQAGDWAQRNGLSDDDAAKLYAVAEEFRTARFETMRALLAEIGEDTDVSDALPAQALGGAIEAQYDPEEAMAVRRSVSKERAGLQTPPTDLGSLSPTERYIRLTFGVGNDFEAAVAGALGPEQAHALRAADQGWPGGTSTYSGRCDDE